VAYYDIAQLSGDADFIARTAAAYATESLTDPERDNASNWATLHAWDMAAAPGFGDAYASAIAGNVERPGKDPAVITDAQILSAIQAIMGAGS
jgi:hypothetical protein